MVTWLTRSLLFIIAGAILAFAVTAHHVTYHRSTLDVQTVGVVLLLVGVFDLLLNFGMLMYMRQPVRSLDPYSHVTRAQHPTAPIIPATPTRRITTTTRDAGPPDDPHETQVLPRDNPEWH